MKNVGWSFRESFERDFLYVERLVVRTRGNGLRETGVGIKFELSRGAACVRRIAGFARKFISRDASGVGSFFARH